MKRKYIVVLGAFVGFAALLYNPFPALAQTAPPLGVLEQFGVLGGSAVTGSTTGTVVSGDVGSNPTPTVSNFPPSDVTPGFIIHRPPPDSVTIQARADATIAFNNMGAQVALATPTAIVGDVLGGLTLSPGFYSCGACLLSTTQTLTLNDPSGTGIFIFDVDSELTADVLSNVAGTANPCNVFWRVGSSATLNGINFRGNVFAAVSITVGAGSDVEGRVIAGTGAVTMEASTDGSLNTIGGCAVVPNGNGPGPAIPTLDFLGLTILVLLLAGAGVFVVNRFSI